MRLLVLIWLIPLVGVCQTSVYDCIGDTYANADLVSGGAVEEATCFIFDGSNYNHPNGLDRERNAFDKHRIEPGFHMGSSTFSGTKDFKLAIVPAPEVVYFGSTHIHELLRYKKFEIGMKLSTFLTNEIALFISSGGTAGLNPFMSDELDIEAVFTHVATGYKDTIDAFYLRDVIRRETGYVPFTGISDAQYKSYVGPASGYTGQGVDGYWEDQETPYFMRIRFAPPELGKWTCKISGKAYDDGTGVILQEIEYPEFDFNVIESGDPGYMYIGNTDHYFKLGDNTFTPIGPNMPWPESRPNFDNVGPDDASLFNEYLRPHPAPVRTFMNFDRMIGDLAESGANHFRFIINPISTDIEFEKLGNYYDRQHLAYEVDRILDSADAKGLRLQFDMMVHYALGVNTNSKRWDWGEYTSAPGTAAYGDYGPYNAPKYSDGTLIPAGSYNDQGWCYNRELNLDYPEEFLTDLSAKDYYKEKLRYMISRWGYSTAIECFELISEINQTGYIFSDSVSNEGPLLLDHNHEFDQSAKPYNQALVQENVESWHDEMARFIKSDLGHTEHLITVSYAGENEGADDTPTLNSIDFITENSYNFSAVPNFFHQNQRHEPGSKITGFKAKTIEFAGMSHKPVAWSETADNKLIYYDTLDLLYYYCDNGASLRKIIWTAPFSGLAFANIWGIWDTPEYWYYYGKVLEFIDGTDFDGGFYNAGQWLDTTGNAWEKMERSDNGAEMSYLRAASRMHAMGVISNRTANFETLGGGSCAQDVPVHDDWDELYPLTAGGSATGLKLVEMNPIPYRIDYYDTETGDYMSSSFANGPEVNVHHPSMYYDHVIAFKAYPAPSGFMVETNDEVVESESLSIEFWPNPTKDEITIRSGYEKAHVTILDANGKIVRARESINTGDNSISVQHLETGMYFLQLEAEGETSTEKLIKEN